MPAAVCEGLKQTMSNTMDLDLPLAKRLSCQRYKKPRARREQKVWLRGEFILSESLAWRPSTSPHFLLHHYSCEAPVEARRPKTGAMAATSVLKLGKQRGRGWVSSFFGLGGILAPQEMHYCTSEQTASLCWGVWRPLEPWTKPAGPSLRLAWNQKQYVERGKHSQKKQTWNQLNRRWKINVWLICCGNQWWRKCSDILLSNTKPIQKSKKL